MIPAGLIYKITNNINNKIYIGLTTRTFEKRMKDYEHEIKSKTRVRRPIISALIKYGPENFQREIVTYCITNIEDLKQLEKYFIKEYQSNNSLVGYNMDEGGDSNRKHPETIEKQRKAMTGRKFSEEHRKNLSLSKKGKPGWRHTPESKAKIGAASKGRKTSEATREKMRIIRQYVSPETRAKLSKSLVGKRPPTCKEVICVETGESFYSMKYLAKLLNVQPETLRRHLNKNTFVHNNKTYIFFIKT